MAGQTNGSQPREEGLPASATPVLRWGARRLLEMLLCALLVMLPFSGHAQIEPRVGHPFVSLETGQGEVLPAMFGIAAVTEANHLQHLLHMDIKQMLALLTGLALGHWLGEVLFEGSWLAPNVAMLAGIAIGSWWYTEQLWPFQSQSPPDGPAVHDAGGHGGGSADQKPAAGHAVLVGEGAGGRRSGAEIEVFRDCPVICPEMVEIPPGAFLMGSPEDEPRRERDEGPQHKVTLLEPFAIGRYEVTFEEWDACVDQGGCKGYRPSDLGTGRGRHPVVSVGWQEAMSYVGWLRHKTGRLYRLPSEAEWEYAARAGASTPFHTGLQITDFEANFNASRTYNGSPRGQFRGRSVSVGSFPPNRFGLFDMHGNVLEWTADCRHDNYRGAPNDGSPWLSDPCRGRVQRGGAWSYGPAALRSANRILIGGEEGSEVVGFRVARDIE